MRADLFFKDKFGSRTKAAEAIEKGQVLVNGKPIRPKDEIKEGDEITFLIPEEVYVSNGGYKLARAKTVFSLDFSGKVCVDIGASTGGFTDCLLQNNAKKVYAVDVGDSQLHPSLLSDKRIVVIGKLWFCTNNTKDRFGCNGRQFYLSSLDFSAHSRRFNEKRRSRSTY